jgi:predicted aspartyl protease
MALVFLLAWMMTAKMAASPEWVLPAKRLSHTMMLERVYLNGHGPFRMLLDTGATSSALRVEIAVRIGVRAKYQVEQVSIAGAALMPAGEMDVRVGGVADREVEVLFSPIAVPQVDGVLGQSWLSRHAYLLDFRKKRLVLDGPPPDSGLRLDSGVAAGRPAIAATVDGQPFNLVIDSGAAALILFRPERRFRKRTMLTAHDGVMEARTGKAVVEIGGLRRTLVAAELPHGNARGLLPASMFDAVYVAKGTGMVVLVP